MDNAKHMRAEPTDAEQRLWSHLRNQQLGYKFRRQHRVCGYVADFACVERKLVVEADGGQHLDRAEYDRTRTSALQAAGYRVLRFWNHEVLGQTEDVLDAICRALAEGSVQPGHGLTMRGKGSRFSPSPQPSPPQAGEREQGRRSTVTAQRAGEQGRRSTVTAPQAGEREQGRCSTVTAPRAGEQGRRNTVTAPRAGESEFWKPAATFDALRLRAAFNRLVREFFHSRAVLEVETPVLSRSGNTEPNIASFSLQFSGRTDGAPRTRWLRTSPEFALKRLLAAGIGDCYELGRVFRDGEAGGRHNPEFTMLEWYRVGWDHLRLLDETVALIRAALALVGRDAVPVVTTFRDLYWQHLRLDPLTADIDTLRSALGDVCIDPDGLTRDDWLDLLMTHRLQPLFGSDVLLAVHDWPASQAALARIREDDPPVAERFELYLGPLELANGYHELRDAQEQRARFERDAQVRAQRGLPAIPLDAPLLAALEHGLPACAGVALGVDRLLMALQGTSRIAEVLAFDFSQA